MVLAIRGKVDVIAIMGQNGIQGALFDSQKSVSVANSSQGKKDGQPDRMLHGLYD